MTKANLSKHILFFTAAIFWFAQYAHTPFVNPQLITMGAVASLMGIIGGAYGFTQFVLRIPVGILSDKWQRKFFVCAGCLCAALAGLIMFLFHNPAGFLLGRALGGVAASSWVSMTVLYVSYFNTEQAARPITVINMANQIGRLLAFITGAMVASAITPQAAFLVSAIGGFAGFVLSLFITEPKQSTPQTHLKLRDFLAVAKERNLLVTSVLAVFVQLLAFATATTFTPNHAVSIGATPAALGGIQVALLVPSIVLSFLLSKFILRRIDAKPLVVIGFFFTALYCVFVPFTATIMQLYWVQALGGIGTTLTFSLLMGLCVERVALEQRGAAMGFFQSIYGIGMTAGPLIMGILADTRDLHFGFLVMAGIATCAMLAAALCLRRPGRVFFFCKKRTKKT
ncbi:MAG: MFS transporter [Oscillospiraceae bacterium]|nr:MFS transporter [Oscillospiraceae bacterium]